MAKLTTMQRTNLNINPDITQGVPKNPLRSNNFKVW
jgi:hypothetical protein